MPFFYDPNLDEDNQDSSQVNLSGASATFNDQGDPQNQTANTDTKSGSGFQNLDKYLKTNNAQEFGQKFQGKVADQVSGAQTQMGQASDQFKTQVSQANRLPTQDQINTAIADPTKADKTEFQGWEKQNYKGPKDISETKDLWNQYWSGAEQAQTNTKLLGTEPGRFTLLDQYFGRPSYNFGEKSLDNLIYQESGLGSQAKQLQDQASQLKAQGNQKALGLRDFAGQRAGEVETSRKNTLKAIGLDEQGKVVTGDDRGAIGSQYKAVDDVLNSLNSGRKTETGSLEKALKDGRLTAEQAQKLGLTNGQNLYDLDMMNYYKGSPELDRFQVMTSDQQAYIKALSELAGITDTYANGDLKEKTNPFTFQKDHFDQDVKAKGQEYERLATSDVFQMPEDHKRALMNIPIRLGTFDYTLGELQQYVNASHSEILRGNDTNAGRKFLSQAEPVLDQYKRDYFNSIYNTGRKLSVG